MMYKFWVLVIALFTSRQVSGSMFRIIGGHEAPPEYGRFHASLQNLSGHHVCGGAVVSNRHVVTAAHCVQGANLKYIRVIVGTTNLDTSGYVYAPISILIHPDFNHSSRDYDIAILKVLRPFDNRHVRVISMRDEELNEGDSLVLTGFGALEPNGESSRQMHALNLSVFDQETCRFAMRYSKNVTDNMFCTFTKIGQGTCHGDSGGPVTKHSYLVGLVSWGIPCAVGFPDVHTRIAPFIKWIQHHIDKSRCTTNKNRTNFNPLPPM
ncbi:hypothetical protein K1T71_006734 [Dendrolimus kikuchii]|uniref:Uncharacterized protein n=1 Tax=Dendrolimus kikuchii TaxID=765133 RepID=A0ACC1D213_9NEOP|nr:hypothetical protein K1T71_006734 [Dendrolimus kikuchii]